MQLKVKSNNQLANETLKNLYMKRICGIALIFVFGFQVSAQESARPTQPNLPGDLMLDFGFSYWSKKLDQLPLKVLGSQSVGIYYTQRMRISDHLSFYPAVGVTFDKYSFDSNLTWRNNQGVVSLDTIAASDDAAAVIDKNKLVVSYFEIPLEIRIHPSGTVKGEGWFIGIGAVAGLRFAAHTKVRYPVDGEKYKEKEFSDFGLERYRYGAQVRFGFKNIHLYYKTYFSDLFSNTSQFSDGKSPRASVIGINISGF